MDLKNIKLLEKTYYKYSNKLPTEVRIFFDDSFRLINDEETDKETIKELIKEFDNKPFKFDSLNHVTLLQALEHLIKKETTHDFGNGKKCKICGIDMKKQYVYKRFSNWHFDKGERIHVVK